MSLAAFFKVGGIVWFIIVVLELILFAEWLCGADVHRPNLEGAVTFWVLCMVLEDRCSRNAAAAPHFTNKPPPR